jgi:hypothetical protein
MGRSYVEWPGGPGPCRKPCNPRQHCIEPSSEPRARAASTARGGPLRGTRREEVIRAFDARLVVVGKAKKVALTACMRKHLTMLNAMTHSQTI